MPTPGVNGQVRSSPALHASKSMLSLAPTARMSVCTGWTASPGSFCLFCENGESLLPTVTSVDPPGVTGTATADPASRTIEPNAAAMAPARCVMRMSPLCASMHRMCGGPQQGQSLRHDVCRGNPALATLPAYFPYKLRRESSWRWRVQPRAARRAVQASSIAALPSGMTSGSEKTPWMTPS